jgi:Tfp pilus assembly protein PilW
MKHDALQAGFTVIELLVASTLGLGLMVVVSSIFFDAVRIADGLRSQLALNRDARVMFEILAYGAVQSGFNNTPATQDYVFGLRWRRSSGASGTGWGAPSSLIETTGGGTQREYRLALSPTDAAPDGPPAGTLRSQEIPGFDVTCTGVDTPVQGCSSGSTKRMKGYLQRDPGLTSTGRLREVTLNLLDPYGISIKSATQLDISAIYWTVFTLNVDQNPI